MEMQALPLSDQQNVTETSEVKLSLWKIIGNTLGLGLFFLSLLTFFDLLSRVPGV